MLSRLSWLGISWLMIALFFGCQQEKEKRFEMVAQEASGINFSNNVAHLPDQNIIEYLYHYNGGGVAVGDINNDGLEDIYLSANQGADQLYLNQGGLKFKNITSSSGITGTQGWSTGVTMADINSDGWLDIYVCQVGGYKSYQGKNKLFINNQDGTFTEQAASYNLDKVGFFTQAAFFDYDWDGDLDVFLLNHAVHTPRSYRPMNQYLPRDLKAGDYLLRNDISNGQQVYTDVTEEAGIIAYARGYGLGLVISDVNSDGWADIYVGNDFHENDYLYINNQDGTFSNELTDRIPHTTQFTMGVDIQDVNRDGKMDIFSVDMMPKDRSIRMKSGGEDPYKLKEAKFSFGFHPQVARNTLNINKGNGQYADIAPMTQMFATDWSWSVLMEDLDNNGWADVFISNGIYKRPNDLDYINFLSNYNLDRYSKTEQDSIERILIEQMPTLKIPNAVYTQKKELDFEEASIAWGLDSEGYSGATALADFDRDGDLDMIINNLNQPAWLLENHSSNDSSQHYLSVELEPEEGSTYLGASVQLYAQGHQWKKAISPVRGFQASGSHFLHFGLGETVLLDSLIVRYQGKIMTRYDVSVDQWMKLSLKELGEELGKSSTTKSKIEVIETNVSIPKSDFQDYNREPLMPHRLSFLGRPYAVTDFNGDGKKEVFVGGANGLSANIYQDNEGKFERVGNLKAFELDAIYEDAACSVGDFNGDGHADIYVVSGGNRYTEGSRWLEDRLYLGDGSFGFKRLDVALPRTNAITVASADYDEDGDLDLFVGSLNVPGAYGLRPLSYVLENTGKGKLVSKQTLEAGMVTDARWYREDVNSRWKLATVGEWEPLKIWSVQDGQLMIDGGSVQFAQSIGWYRSLLIDDINRDGRPDFILGNIGQNTTLPTSQPYPVKLYLDDYDGNGQLDPIISYFMEGNEIPLASKDMLIGQIPVLKKEYVSYKKFAEATTIPELLGDLYNPTTSRKSIANDFSHAMYLSTDTTYHKQLLPKGLQVSPINSMQLVDLNYDGVKDLITAGNFMDHFSMMGQLDANGLSIAWGKKSTDELFDSVQYLSTKTNHFRYIRPLNKQGWLAIPRNGNLLKLQFPSIEK